MRTPVCRSLASRTAADSAGYDAAQVGELLKEDISKMQTEVERQLDVLDIHVTGKYASHVIMSYLSGSVLNCACFSSGKGLATFWSNRCRSECRRPQFGREDACQGFGENSQIVSATPVETILVHDRQ